MSEAIAVALITAGATIAAQLIISKREWEQREKSLIEQNTAVNIRLERLETAIEKQSDLVERIYKTEAEMNLLKHSLEAGNIRC